jgi:hypothetical protein
MKLTRACSIILATCALGCLERARAEGPRELKVHLAQANNNSPYAFVRAKFNPGEVADPWAVRFFDDQGKEVPYFVWDSITWRVAREGRADWGQRYALLNHGPGNAPQVVEARANKLVWAKKNLPDLGASLEAQEQAANQAPNSVCAAMYLLRHLTPAFGKERLTLRIYPEKQVEPKRRQWRKLPEKAEEPIRVAQGVLELRDLPDRLAVFRSGKEIFRHAGFQAGGQTDATSHADAARPFVVETAEGIITKIAIAAQTRGRQDGAMDWQCCYWLFPEGGFVALEGFALSDKAADSYVGGTQTLSIWQAGGGFSERHLPSWDTPWWLHQAGERGFVASHLFYATPLTIGFGNNPFAVNAEGPSKDPKVEAEDGKLALTWFHRIDDPAITRLMTPQPLRRPGDPPPPGAKPEAWRPKLDWLYRQYIVGVGDKAPAAEAALRDVLGAAAGWIDRPLTQEEIAVRMIAMMPRLSNRQSAEVGLLGIVPALMANDQAAVRESLRKTRDQVERTDFYINLIKDWVARGGRPSAGGKIDPDGTRREGWTGNACYHAGLMPCYVRVLEHFEVPFRQKEYRDAIVRFADFTLEILSTDPPKASRERERPEKIDYDRLNATFQTEWPSRIAAVIPLVLHAYTLQPDEKYARAAKLLFEDLMRLVERNPHGYWSTWSFTPKADKFDTVYNPVGYERGIAALWSDEQLERIGRDRAARFVAAQARWFVFSGQLLDTLETDNPTAIRACTHGGHTANRNQIGIYLYDDFNFYRGLLGDLVTWSAAACQVPGRPDAWAVGAYRGLELSNAGSSMLRWALDIRPGSKWLESKVQRLGDKGFRLQAWNRLPKEKPTIKVAAKDVGFKAETDVLHVQLNGPAFRLPSEVEVSWTADKVALVISRPVKIRLDYGVLRPEWAGKDRPVLQRRSSKGAADIVRNDVVWNGNTVEWQAGPGEYQLLRAAK